MVQTLEQLTEVAIPRRKFTREEYYRIADTGVFEGERVELIEGEVVQMSPIGPAHTVSVHAVFACLLSLLGEHYFVRMQSPLSLGDSEPEPDVAVVSGKPGDYREAHPTSAVLAVEVAQSSLDYDRVVKGRLYAQAGIPEYWLVNLEERCVEVYRDPSADRGYRFKRIYTPGETFSCLQKPDSPISVETLIG